MRSAGQLLVNRLQRCGVNVDHCFSVFVLNDWLREFFVSRDCSNGVQNSSIHASSSFNVANKDSKSTQSVLCRCFNCTGDASSLNLCLPSPASRLRMPATESAGT